MADPHPVVTYSKEGAKFDDVRDDLKLAIEGKGLVIDYESYVNRMLERTGKDVGSARKLYADAQAFVFCSAALSRKTMEADPANVSFCPYTIMLYGQSETFAGSASMVLRESAALQNTNACASA